MKNLKLLVVALVAMFGFSSCNKDCGHNFIEYDYSEALIGTWTYLSDEGLSESMVINPDGSFDVTGVMQGGYLYESKGTISVVNNKVSLVFEGDTDVIEGRLELVTGKSLSIVINEEYDIRLTYDYCETDLSDEIVGMWVCNDGWTNDIVIQTFTNDGKTTMTTATALDSSSPIVNQTSNYVVCGDMLYRESLAPNGEDGKSKYIAARLTYTPNGTAFGDIMTHKVYFPSENGLIENVGTYLRVKQSLNFTGTYDYSSAYVSNVKGKDEDFTIFGHTFNIANITAENLDVFFRSELFRLDLNANSIKHYFHPYGRDVEVETPVTVDGNNVILDFGAIVPALRKVEMYMFQDKDDSQMHIYMPTQSFINYFANLEIVTMLQAGKIDPADATAVAKVFADMEARIESINVSFVMKARK